MLGRREILVAMPLDLEAGDNFNSLARSSVKPKSKEGRARAFS